ncbi:M13 family metallopeptidase [Flammeovirga yaeyamensis]|uniref:M13 family metallopeptidase n=1 Tax=Flammeovirga yaeyamensis TaxID=367791 RepID=A0AAX1N534_9BACT|nr:M13 family metallopeptidase [Flammeovirga yaeyamensis]MBB3701336.1 putative endopeptidase [Flammeovirga yaeyamensis]NMF38196.1 M13 family metallopeptidase [Flammeovirga yaeyamensis]QWG02610.1 M13 family metallopeptidase [Flammeovirga yaeyamensis]
MKLTLRSTIGASLLMFGLFSTTSHAQDKALDLNNMDTSVKPGEDFYNFANGGWMKKAEIPADRGRWGSFDELRERNEKATLRVLNDAAESGKLANGSDQEKAVFMYESGMDSATIEKLGYSPVKPYLAEVDKIKSLDDLQEVLEKLHDSSTSVFFGMGVYQDLKDSKTQSLYLGYAGLGLPNKDYYTKDDSASVAKREQYVQHIENMMRKIGVKKQSQKIFDLENALAEFNKTPVEARDPRTQYNPMTVAELQGKCKTINWTTYLKHIDVPAEKIIVNHPIYFEKLDSILVNTNIKTIKNYLKWHIIHEAAPYLSSEFVNESFDFYGKKMRGLEENRPRWKRVLGTTNSTLGFAVGKLYVETEFPAEAKEKAEKMVNNIKEAFAERIKKVDWMSAETKEKALNKLANFTVKIGYPDKWETYENLEIKKGEYFQNIVNSSIYETKKNFAEYGKPVDKTKWGMTPQTVNAYYNPLYNEIVFPAAILQPPFYNYKADEAVNYGGIGAVIGHEISHGFDDQGRRFDAKGEMQDWWTKEDGETFQGKAQMVIDQYNGYYPLEELHINGELTLGENIADIGGVAVAYDGLQRYLSLQAEKPGMIDGFTPEQRFFLSWATIWRTKSREEALRNQIMTDPHSPGQFRATGPLSDFDPFYEAFHIKKGDKMYVAPEKRAKVW